jgi:predicted membrane-bound spermidine synthase
VGASDSGEPARPTRSGEAAAHALVFVLFFTSGFAALLYQVIWQRVLALFSGADVYSVTIIVAAFMAGLGCGSLVGGHVADRVSAGRRVLLFALAELAVAAFAFVSLPLYHDVLHERFGHLGGSPLTLALLLFVSLLWPTFFMGMSLPLLARALTRRVEGSADTVGALYAVNTLGAAVGALLTTWVLVRTLGFDATVRLGAWLNVGAAAGALLLRPFFAAAATRDASPGPAAVGAAAPAEPSGAQRGLAVPAWIAIYGVSGFVALSLEIAWFRLLGVVVKSTAFTFGTLLSLYLAGLTVGTVAGIRWARRSARPAAVFLLLQAGVSAYAGLSLLALGAMLARLPAMEPLQQYLASYEPLDMRLALDAFGTLLSAPSSLGGDGAYALKQFLMLYVAVPLVVIGPPTVMMGLSFPLLQKVVQRDLASLGRRVGWLQTSNICGSMLGAGLTGWVFLRYLGTAATLRLLVLLGVFFLGLAVHVWRGRRAATGGAVAALAVCLVALAIPGQASLWATLHGTTRDRVLSAEDGSGLSVLKSRDPGLRGGIGVYANGLGQSDIPFPDHHLTLGMLPAMLHPDPRRIAIIGLGSGATLYAAGGRAETTRITSIEIVAPQLETLRQLDRRQRYGGVQSVLEDPRIEFLFADARAVLRQGDERYDVIEADALRPTSAYAGNLFSLEYFTLLRERLAPGGLAVSWAPTERVVDTFVRVFPHAVLCVAGGVRVLLGSDRPIAWDGAALRARLTSDFSRAYYARAGVDVERYARIFGAVEPTFFSPRDDRRGLTDVNTDLFPRDEFLVPRAR